MTEKVQKNPSLNPSSPSLLFGKNRPTNKYLCLMKQSSVSHQIVYPSYL
jgi:hypothetical protein